jgi:hypothetical protein
MYLFIPLVALTVLIIVIAFLIKSRKRVEPPVRPQPVETNIIGLDTAPHNQLRNLVRPIVPDVDDVTMSFLGETTEHDARFIIESMCRRASAGSEHEFVLGNIIYHDIVSAGALGNLVSVGAVAHTKKLSIRFAAIVEWDGNLGSEPIVRSVTFDELEIE